MKHWILDSIKRGIELRDYMNIFFVPTARVPFVETESPVFTTEYFLVNHAKGSSSVPCKTARIMCALGELRAM
jgi:hypothetical protein